jgi:2-polyprenyl-3-methyl-5-hydroxy-6-metoxy-1,4-benzoquinol methylase
MPAKLGSGHDMIKNYHRSYMQAKARFVKRMLLHRVQGQSRICPYCKSGAGVSRLTRKKLIMDILVCAKCRLIFRWPLDTVEELDTHYDAEFAEETPQVRLPAIDSLKQHMEDNFASIFGPDLNHKMNLLKAIRRSGRVLDYGCSWGYSSHLMRKNGYEVIGFEVSKPRAEYARKNLGLSVIDSVQELDALPSGSFDVIYSNNVLEHLPMIGDALATCGRLLNENGVTIHALPNFGGRARQTGQWLNWIGEDHPIAPTCDFFRLALPAAGLTRFNFASAPFDEQQIGRITDASGPAWQLDGDELLIVAQK